MIVMFLVFAPIECWHQHTITDSTDCRVWEMAAYLGLTAIDRYPIKSWLASVTIFSPFSCHGDQQHEGFLRETTTTSTTTVLWMHSCEFEQKLSFYCSRAKIRTQ